jgi:Glycosyl transferase family 2
VYNDERFLPESIRSVLGQTFRDIELVLIDDGLTDQSWKIVEGAALVFMLPGGIESVHAQQASPSAQKSVPVDPCSSPTNEKLTPFEDLLLDQVENAVRNEPSNASEIVVKAIATNVSNPLNYPGHVIQRAVRALGQNVKQADIATIVFGAVRARPEAVLETVPASIEKNRPRFHTKIVAAAVAAVGDPYMRVETSSLQEFYRQSLHVPREPILWDRLRCIQGGQETVEEGALGYKLSTDPVALTLAEAIINSAIQAGSPVSSFDLQQAVDLVLQNGLGLSSITGNPADSGTLITVPPPVFSTPSTPTPTPSPVSP